MEPKETIPSLNLYLPIKTRAAVTTTKQETVKQDTINQDNNKQESNIKETFSSTKNKELTTNLNNPNVKKIHLFEFNPKNHSNTVEYYLNNILKNNKSCFPPLTSQISSSLFKVSKKNNSNLISKNSNNNLIAKGSGLGNIMSSNIQDDEDPPFNVLEIHSHPKMKKKFQKF